MKRRTVLACTFCLALYVLAFQIVHRSHTLRRPATNMNYWYYSDQEVVEAVEFYGFWPLRQAVYRTMPSFAPHYHERRGSPVTR